MISARKMSVAVARCRRSRVPATMTWTPVRVGCSVFLNNRYYDPTTGVFLSVDPLVATTGDPYLYANGNPTTLSDPLGLCSVYSPTQGIVDDGHGKCQGTSHLAPRPKAPPVKPAGPPTLSWLTMPSTCDDAGIPWLCRHLGFDDHSQGATIARSIAFGAMMSGGGEPEVPPGLAAAEAELDALVEGMNRPVLCIMSRSTRFPAEPIRPSRCAGASRTRAPTAAPTRPR